LILHQIHWRVFQHIKRLAEQDWATSNSNARG
jgi:hypothetical protein